MCRYALTLVLVCAPLAVDRRPRSPQAYNRFGSTFVYPKRFVVEIALIDHDIKCSEAQKSPRESYQMFQIPRSPVFSLTQYHLSQLGSLPAHGAVCPGYIRTSSKPDGRSVAARMNSTEPLREACELCSCGNFVGRPSWLSSN